MSVLEVSQTFIGDSIVADVLGWRKFTGIRGLPMDSSSNPIHKFEANTQMGTRLSNAIIDQRLDGRGITRITDYAGSGTPLVWHSSGLAVR